MRAVTRVGTLAMLAFTVVSCTDRAVTSSEPIPQPTYSSFSSAASLSTFPDVRISQFHYDDDGTDAGEAVEISAPAGMNLSGYSIVLYNGSTGAAYNTKVLSGVVPTGQQGCGPRGVVQFSYPSNGLQNGSPDGIALVHGTELVEFISYEGSFTASGGAADGVTSTDVGVSESGDAVGTSIQRQPQGSMPAWVVGPEQWGVCSDYAADVRVVSVTAMPTQLDIGQQVVFSAAETHNGAPVAGATFTFEASHPALLSMTGNVGTALAAGAVQVTATSGSGASGVTTVTINAVVPSVRFSEIHYDNVGGDTGERIEVEAPAGTNLDGWKIVLYNGSNGEPDGELDLGGTITARCSGRGVLAIDAPGLQNGSPDGMALVNADGAVIEFLSYEGTMTAVGGAADGLISTDIGESQSGDAPGMSLARSADGKTWSSAPETFGRCNFGDQPPSTVLVTHAPDVVRAGQNVTFTASLTNGAGEPVETTFAWTSSDNAALSINSATGAAQALAEGTVTVTAQAADGTAGSATVTILGEPKGELDITIDGFNDVPVGFTKMILTLKYVDANGSERPYSEIRYVSRDPAIATVTGNYANAVSEGEVWIVATGVDNAIDSTIVRVRPFTLAGGHDYARSNVEFGVPADANPADDFIIERQQFALSYNTTRGGANWVSWVVNATHFNDAISRCNCFTADPELPESVRIHHSDFTGSGYSRGHMAMSEQRTSTLSENAASFYMTNMLPQHSSNNGGPWLRLENHVNDLAREGGREVYNIAGGIWLDGAEQFAGGRVHVPSYTWKVVVVMPRGAGISHVDAMDDIEVIAIRTPNDHRAGVPGSVVGITGAWQDYETTVDALEAETGYDLLALLPDHIEALVESKTHAPVAMAAGPSTAAEGETIAVSAAGSADADGDDLTFEWSFGNGDTAAGEQATYTYPQDGSFTVMLVVRDVLGVADTATFAVAVGNVAPAVAAFDGAALLPGETYTAAGTFTDPGADSWTAAVDYGTGGGFTTLPLTGSGFTLSHEYATAGSYSVTVAVRDDDTSSDAAAVVTVLTQTQAVESMTTQLDAGVQDQRELRSLRAKLEAVIDALARQNNVAAANQLRAFINEVDAMERTARMPAARAAALRSMAQRVITSLSVPGE